VSRARHNLWRVEGQVAKILHNKPEEALKELRKISSLIDSQIPYRDGHSERVAEYSIKTAKRLGLIDEDMVTLEAAALLHDFGKIGVEDDILEKPASSDRLYRKARTKDQAVQELKKYAGVQFDPKIVNVFLKVLES
jgi:HD-GYP domain-containing protein (c-di-GMP phosphodiesterase class II)